MRLALAALFSVFVVGPSLAGSSATIQVGLVITGDTSTAVVGSWASKTAVTGGIQEFQISGGSRFSSELVIAPQTTADTAAGCRIRTSGAVRGVAPVSAAMARYFENHHYLTPDYVVHYSISSAEAIGASTGGRCTDIADSFAHFASTASPPRSLFLTKGDNGELIDSMAGTAFARTSAP